MSTEKILILSALAFGGSYLLTPWAKKMSEKLGAVDLPNYRKIHKGTVARGGGIAIFLGFLLAFLFFNRISPEISGFIIGAFLIILLGVTDDLLGLTALPKFIAQAFAAIVVIYFGININLNTVLGGRLNEFYFLSIPITFFWIVGITNAINLIDGLDGLAAGVTTISAFTISAVAFLTGRVEVGVLALILGFAALGFLPHNFRSRIFMGDSGSMFLGYCLATLSVMGSTKLAAAFSLFVPMTILAIPIFDTLFSIYRRIREHRPIYEGDKKHIHHRLLDLGFSPLQVVIFTYLFSIFFGGMAIFSTIVRTRYAYYIFAVSFIVIIAAGIIIVGLHQKKMGEDE